MKAVHLIYLLLRLNEIYMKYRRISKKNARPLKYFKEFESSVLESASFKT